MSQSPTKRFRVEEPSPNEIRDCLNNPSTVFLPHDGLFVDDDSDFLTGYESDQSRTPEPSSLENLLLTSKYDTLHMPPLWILMMGNRCPDPTRLIPSMHFGPLYPDGLDMASVGWSPQDDDYNIFRPVDAKDMPACSSAGIEVESAKPNDQPLRQANLLNLILGEIVLTWPPDSKASKTNRGLSLVNSHIFAVERIVSILDLWENVCINGGGTASKNG
ncbi:hypothetical protein ONZ45_g18945 [Pleurotus djamor]|nr:hypothetical protein ONZ45_g18945 [Pleurotus djamor]